MNKKNYEWTGYRIERRRVKRTKDSFWKRLVSKEFSYAVFNRDGSLICINGTYERALMAIGSNITKTGNVWLGRCQ